MFIRIGNLKEMDKEYYLKEVQPCPKFKEARQIHRDPSRVIYYFKRSGGFPPLLMEQKGLVNPPEAEDQPEPKPAPAEEYPPCAICGGKNDAGEVCKECAKTNNPFPEGITPGEARADGQLNLF